MHSNKRFKIWIGAALCCAALTACGDGGTATVGFDSNAGGKGAKGGTGASIEVSAESRIYNGIAVDPLVAPQMVQIQLHYPDGTDNSVVNGLCSGFVIGTSSILSAGHCFKNGAIPVSVISGGQVQPIESISIPPDYMENPEVQAIFNDIAVVKAAVSGLPNLPILATQAVIPESEVVVYGYGLGDDQIAGILRAGQTSLEIVTPNHFFGPYFDGSGTNSCLGDSGGPAIQAYTKLDGTPSLGVVGIVSSGLTEECGASDVTLFTNLQNPHLLDFIRSLVPDVLIE